jgi:hypothetical protein
VLAISAVITRDIAASDEQYGALVQKIKAECMCHGEVRQAVVPREVAAGGFGKAFVEFSTVLDAIKARTALQDQALLVEFYDHDSFAAGRLDR